MLRGKSMSLRKALVTSAVCGLALAAAPRNASADWTLTPFVGWNFGGSADVNNPAAGNELQQLVRTQDRLRRVDRGDGRGHLRR